MFHCKCFGLLLWVTQKINEWALFSFLSFSFFLIWYFTSILLHYLLISSSIDPPAATGSFHDVTNDFLVPGCICAIAASEKSIDTVWFVKILEKHVADQPYTDDYRLTVAKGQKKFSGRYLEWASETRHKIYFSRNEQDCFSTRPALSIFLLTLKMNKNLYSISQSDYCDFTFYVEHFGMMPLQLYE